MGSPKKSGKAIYIVAIVAVLVIVTAFLFWPKASSANLKKPLSELLNISEDYIQLNIPPANNRYPGSIVSRSEQGSLNYYKSLSEIEIDTTAVTSTMTLATELSESAKTGFYNAASGVDAKTNGDFEVSISLSNLKVIECKGGVAAIRNQLLGDADIIRMRSKNSSAEVIVKSIRALPVFTIKRGSKLSAEMWEKKAKQISMNLGGTIDEKGNLQITTSAPVVVAFETLQISYVTDQMAPGAPVKVELTPVKARDEEIAPTTKADNIRSKVGFVTIGNGVFSNSGLGDLPAADNSIAMVSQCLASRGAVPVLSALNKRNKWTKKDLLEELTNIGIQTKTLGLENLIVYYIGHSAVSRSGHTYLFMSDYDEHVDQLVGGEIDLATNDESTTHIHEAGEVIEGINASVTEAEEIPKTLSLDEICKVLSKQDINFVLLVDGCSVRNGNSQIDYTVGFESYPGMTDGEKRAMLNLVEHYSVPLCMSDYDIILAERPGMAAKAVKHPNWEGIGPDVGPLAAAIFTNTKNDTVANNPRPWDAFLSSLVEINGEEREWPPSGIISWSNFENWPSEI